MKKALLILSIAATALAACNKSETTPAPQQQGDRVIRFTSNFSTYTITKAASVLDNKTVKILAGAPINASTVAEANDGQLTPATVLRWEVEQTEPTTFASIYPDYLAYQTEFTYSLSNGDFAFHSSVLTATATVEPENVVNFVYKHPFAMLKIAVTNNLDNTPAISGVTVAETAGSATLDIAAATVSDLGAAAAIDATLDNGKYCVVILPQTAKPVIFVTVGEMTYKFVITSDVEFAANKFYNVALTLDESTPPVVEGEEVAFGFTVSDWEEAEDEVPVLNVTEKWTVTGTVNDGNWGEDIDMTYNENTGVWSVAGISFKAGNEFKLRKALDWAVTAGLKEGVSTVGDQAWDGHLTAPGENIKLAAPGIYTLTFKPEDYAFTATKTADLEPEPEPEPEPAPTVVWKVVGTMNNWSYATGIVMTETEGVWEADLEYEAGDEFKIWDGDETWLGMKTGWTYYGLNEIGDGNLVTTPGAPNIVIAAEGGVTGNYHLALTPASTPDPYKLVITEIVPEP